MPLWLLIPTILINLFTVYIGVTALFMFKKRKPYPKAEPDTRFAVVIPARNEEKVIGNLIRALQRQEYPKDKFDIWVAANNCTDRTAEIAQSLGANVFAATGTITCKGDVLHQVMETLLPMDYDAFVFFDADNIPVPDFLQRMNDALAAGERVCKGRLKSGNARESWVSGSYGLYHALLEWTYSRPHSAMGCSSNLVGTAFAAHRQVFDELGGWNTVSLCEDTEFLAQSTRIGHRVAWVYEAMSYDEQVARFGVSLRQRLRWCSGMIRVARNETKHLLSKNCPKRKMAIDLAMLFIVSHTSPIAFALMLLSLPFVEPVMLLLMAGGMVLACIGMMLLAAVLCYAGGYGIKGMGKTILLFPIFMASFIPLQFYALFEPVRKWEVVEHNGQAEAE